MDIDIAVGGAAHDVLRADVAARLLGCMREGRFRALFVDPPCSSFSVAHSARLRTRSEPEGALPVPTEWVAYLRKHNALAAFSAALVEAADSSGTPWALENPADCGDAEGPAWWERFAEHAPIWLLP
eukprot:5674614-Pleurochrysis_carterae.AAC.1